MRRPGNPQNGLGNVAFDVGSQSVAFDADHPIGRELIITAHLAAAKEAACITRDGNSGRECRVRGCLPTPSATHVAADVAAGPSEDGNRRDDRRRRLVDRRPPAQVGGVGRTHS